jgi:hypothetical protein
VTMQDVRGLRDFVSWQKKNLLFILATHLQVTLSFVLIIINNIFMCDPDFMLYYERIMHVSVVLPPHNFDARFIEAIIHCTTTTHLPWFSIFLCNTPLGSSKKIRRDWNRTQHTILWFMLMVKVESKGKVVPVLN